MTREEAIYCLRNGGKVRRPRWAKGSYLFMRGDYVWECAGSHRYHNRYESPEQSICMPAGYEEFKEPAEPKAMRKTNLRTGA